ncbi:MAG TPA: glycosyltransferase family 87 protein [Vicinamibacterales bacterium]|nr:glycosyltransferase family 87 protein [Vicinamibacterales bacterium]
MLLAVALGAYPLRVSRNMRDFEVWWTAADRAAAAQPLYRTEDGHYQFKYLPAFAVLAMPIGVVPLAVAKPLWFFISVALIVALIAFSIRLLPEQRRPTWVLAVIAVLIMGKFYARELDLGQVNLAFAVAATGAFVAMKARREMLAAALLVLTIAIKPYGVLLLPGLVVRRQMPTAVAAAIGVWLLLLLPVPLYGLAGTIDLHWGWWQTVTQSTPPNLLSPDNVSIASMYGKWLGLGTLSVTLATATSFALLGAAAIVFLRRRTVSWPEGLEGSLLLLLIPLLSPQGWDYVLLMATPAVIYLANYQDLLPAPLRALTVVAALTIGFSIWDLMGRAAYSAFMAAAVLSVCALVLVGAVASLRLRAVA